MAFTASEQALYDFAKSALPKFLFQDASRAEEVFGAFVKMFDAANTQVIAFFEQALILQATGALPDWLNQHAIDRGTSRQESETDPDLRARLRNIEDALTRPLIISAVQDIITASGITGNAAMVEMPRDAAFLTDYAADTGTGGIFADLGAGEFRFTPDTPFQTPVTIGFTGSGDIGNPQMVFSGALSGGNDGTYVIKRFDNDGVVFDNVGVAETDAGVSWSLQKREINGNVTDGFRHTYLGRGYRTRSTGIIIILPFGCTASTESAVLEALRQKKGAGVLAVVECRANP